MSQSEGDEGGSGGGGRSPCVFCPVHRSPCRRFQSKQGRPFFKCLRKGCSFVRFGSGSGGGGGGGGGAPNKRSPQRRQSSEAASEKKRPRRSESTPASGGGRSADVVLQLCARDRVCAKAKNGAVSAAFARVPGAVFDKAVQEWSLPLSQQDAAVEALRAAGFSASAVPSEVLAELRSTADEEEATDFTSLPDELLSSMFPFQVRGFAFGVQKGGRCMICDEMGLGKTVQAIAIAAHYRAEWPVLVIAPSSVRDNWATEFKKWIPDIPQHQINVVGTSKDQAHSLINVVSYDLITKMPIAPGTFKVIIADESHYLKNPDTIRTRKVVPLLKAAKRAILLTGTPALSRPIELYPQLVALGHQIFPNMTRFGKRYCNAFFGPFGMDYSGHSNLKELHTILSETVMIRRLKSEVLTELPKKNRQIIPIEPDKEKVSELSELLKKLQGTGQHLADGNGNLDRLSAEKRSVLMEIFFKSAGAKAKPAIEYVTGLADAGRKFLVFAHHQVLLDALEEALVQHGVRLIRIDGGTPSKRREELVERFQRDETVLVALLSLTAAGMGITLNAADLVVFAELYWTPGILMQAEDRAHRIGQRNIVNVQFLIAHKTVDDFIWPLIEKKLIVLGRTMDGTGRKLNAVKVKPGSNGGFEVVEAPRAIAAAASSGRPSPRLQQLASAPQPASKQKNLFDFFSAGSGPFRNASSETKPPAGVFSAAAAPIVEDEILADDSDEDETVHPHRVLPLISEEDDAIISEESEHPTAPRTESPAVEDPEDEATQAGMLWDPHEDDFGFDPFPMSVYDDFPPAPVPAPAPAPAPAADGKPSSPPLPLPQPSLPKPAPCIFQPPSLFATPRSASGTTSKYFMEPIVLPKKDEFDTPSFRLGSAASSAARQQPLDEPSTPLFAIRRPATAPRPAPAQRLFVGSMVDEDGDDQPSFSLRRSLPPPPPQVPTSSSAAPAQQQPATAAAAADECDDDDSRPSFAVGAAAHHRQQQEHDDFELARQLQAQFDAEAAH